MNEKSAPADAVAGGGPEAAGGPGPDAVARRLAELVSPQAVDRMLADAEAVGMPLDGAEGLLAQMNKAVLERALGSEMDDHLGYVCRLSRAYRAATMQEACRSSRRASAVRKTGLSVRSPIAGSIARAVRERAGW
jgi:hypothetical protein